jgi:hypothetical protein
LQNSVRGAHLLPEQWELLQRASGISSQLTSLPNLVECAAAGRSSSFAIGDVVSFAAGLPISCLVAPLHSISQVVCKNSDVSAELSISCHPTLRYNGKEALAGFKRNNEEYLNKIKQAAEEHVKSILTDSKLILKLATLSVIEALRINPELCNFVLYNTSVVTASSTIYGSNYPLLVLSGQQQQQTATATII